jgi:hypothetical protein
MLQRVKEYNEHQSINQSRLKKLLGAEDPRTFLMDIELKSQSLTIGSLVDCLLTSPDEFPIDYYVSQLESLPSDTIQAILQETLNSISLDATTSDNLENHRSYMVTGQTFSAYQPNWKLETKIAKVIEQGSELFKEMIVSRGRTIISRDDWDLANIVANSIKNNSTVGGFITHVDENIQLLFQHPIYFKVNGIECKALLDVLRIDHAKKNVQIIDIKTMSGATLEFPNNVQSYKYDLQMAFYYLAVQSLTSMPNGPIHNYNIECAFIVESTTNVGHPLMYFCTKDFINLGLYGRAETFAFLQEGKGVKYANSKSNYSLNFKKREGIIHLLNKYSYYMQNGWEKNQRIAQHDSVFTLDWFGIV